MRTGYYRLILPLLLLPFCLPAQTPPQIPPGGLIQLQVSQPGVDTQSPVTASAAFDPPVVRAGQKTFYRAGVEATESSIDWPSVITAPPELIFGPDVRGQIIQTMNGSFRPLTAYVYEVQTASPGHFTITNFTVNAYGQQVEVPSADLEVVADDPVPPPVMRRIVMTASATNLFIGEPFRISVMLTAGEGNQIEALREIQLNGDGFMIDKTVTRQSVETVNHDGQLKPTFVCEMTVTPIATGPLKISAQGFTAGREFSGQISITGQVVLSGAPPHYVLLTSDTLAFNVRPLPSAGFLPGYTGTVGKFFSEPAHLSTNRMRVGEAVQLRMSLHGEGQLTRFVPPEPPRSRDWQIIADKPPGANFTLIPLADDLHATPEIPFSSFDPATGKYVDLTIPPIPVTVLGEGLPLQLPVMTDEKESAAPLSLSSLVSAPGQTVSSLRPLQLQTWFVVVQFLPVIGFFALLRWDRHRRFLEAHPEIVRRRHARRALRREKRQWRQAVADGDSTAFVQSATRAMQIACAPHFPANPRALVCADVLEVLAEADRNGSAGETVRKIFAVTDARFADTAAAPSDLLALESKVEAALLKLEEKL